MPELPEVETLRKYLEACCLKHQINGLDILDQKILKTSPDHFHDALISHHFVKIFRTGKYLYWQLSSGQYMMTHFGLTGNAIYANNTIELPRFTRIVIHFQNHFYLAITSLRKFGKVQIIEDIDRYEREIALGPDALKINKDQFIQNLGQGGQPIKTRLLDQQLTAGIGNWIADEMLYQSRIHPLVKVKDLNENQIEALFKNMKLIIEIALELSSDFDKFPDHFLVKNRKEGAICHHTENLIQRISIGGRGTYFSPEWQKMK